MDFLKKFSGGNKAQQPVGAGGQPAGQKDDYVDKLFAAGSKKSGHNFDKNTQEKITDGARGLFEKFTGKKVSSKISN